MQRPIYLDYASTTPVDAQVRAAMEPYWSEIFGNPASPHAAGLAARTAVEEARAAVAALIGAKNPSEILFTTSATEANNIALLGFARAHAHVGRHIISQKTEHSSVLQPLRALEKEGFEVTWLDCDAKGRVTAAQVEKAITDKTILVSIMTANNEVGTILPIEKIAAVCRARKVTFHTDAAQAAGKIPVDIEKSGVDLLTLSAHKIYGPKGISALYVRNGVRLSPVLFGGGHERGLRPGTLSTPLVVGYGKACEIAAAQLKDDTAHARELKEKLWHWLTAKIPRLHRHGDTENALPGVLTIGIEGVDGEVLFKSLTTVCLSSGAACASAKGEPSHVLMAMGMPESLARASLRLSIGRPTTDEEIHEAAREIIRAVENQGNKPYEGTYDRTHSHSR